MRNRISFFPVALFCTMATLCAANANWQYPGEYTNDGWYIDDGSRFTISVRGGASFSFADIKNDISSMTSGYYQDAITGEIISESWFLHMGEPTNYEYIGTGDWAKLDANEKYSDFSFATGASLGWVVSGYPRWRLEVGWDHIAETEYNVAPLFSGRLMLNNGIALNGIGIGAVQSTMSTDIVSAVAFYDFFDGLQKPVGTFIPYVGFGVGYADTTTTMDFSDLDGVELSSIYTLAEFGELDDNGVLQFYQSKTNTSNVSALIAAGVSYGIDETIFLDLGVRAMYVPRVKWALTNATNTKHRALFSAENLIYTNVMLGIRFEF